jgi:hypothetical protein
MVVLKDKEKSLIGIFRMKVLKAGKVIEETEERNLIVDVARIQMAHLIGGDGASRQLTKISFGTNGTDPVVSDTEITSPFTKNLDGHTYPEEGQVTFNWSLTTSEDNGQAILEFGLMSADGSLFARRTRANPIYKEADIALQGTWTIIF